MSTEKLESASPSVLLRAKKAAKILDISVRHFYELVRQGKLPNAVRLGRCVRWDRDELLEWAKNKGDRA